MSRALEAEMSRLLLITPVRDEEEHLARTIEAVAAQTRRPDRWLLVDDGSTDATPQILAAAAGRHDFITVLPGPGVGDGGPDRLAEAAEATAFNQALASVDLAAFTHLGKLDADVELDRRYLEGLLAAFELDPDLGLAGGELFEREPDGSWQRTKIPAHHVRGALKTYTRECFEAIGGIEERLGWDTIDETYARMLGYGTRSLPALTARHHRPVATRGGVLRGRARHGTCAYVLRYGFVWVLGRSFKVAASRPYVLSGIAFLCGYLSAAVRRRARVEDPDFKRFVRRELRGRMLGKHTPERGLTKFQPSEAS